jgi:hypothetical protein
MIDDQAPTIEPDTPTPITDSPPTHPRQPSSTEPVNGHTKGGARPFSLGCCSSLVEAGRSPTRETPGKVGSSADKAVGGRFRNRFAMLVGRPQGRTLLYAVISLLIGLIWLRVYIARATEWYRAARAVGVPEDKAQAMFADVANKDVHWSPARWRRP